MKLKPREMISIRSIDIGFDVRSTGQTVELPDHVTTVLCDLPDRDGYIMPRKKPVTGSQAAILKTLRGLGYSVRFKNSAAKEVDIEVRL